MSNTLQKLRALRARTDRELLILVQSEIDRGLTVVELATTMNSSLFARAEKAYCTATALLPTISGISQEHRLRIEGKANELRTRLDEVLAYANEWSFLVSIAS